MLNLIALGLALAFAAYGYGRDQKLDPLNQYGADLDDGAAA